MVVPIPVGKVLTKGSKAVYKGGTKLIKEVAPDIFGKINKATKADIIDTDTAVKTTTTSLNKILSDSKGSVKPEPNLLKPSASNNYIPEGTDLTQPIAKAKELRKEASEGMTKALDAGKNYPEKTLSQASSIGGIDDQKKLFNLGGAEKDRLGFEGTIPREAGRTELIEALTKTGRITQKYMPEIEHMTYQELHHELMKSLYSAYVDQAWRLVEDPASKANEADIINLNYLAKQYGFGLGDWGVEAYPRLAHNQAHTITKATGVEPTGKALKAKVSSVYEHTDMDSLLKGFENSLEEIAIPMRRQMDLHRRAYEILPKADRINVIRLRGQKDAAKRKLLDLMQITLRSNDIPFPKKGVTGQQLLTQFKDEIQVTKEISDLSKKIDELRFQGKSLEKQMKSALGPQIEEDIQMDIDLMERIIDNQGEIGIDRTSRNYRLMQESLEESRKGEIEPTFENRTKEEWLSDMKKLKEGKLHYPGQKRKR